MHPSSQSGNTLQSVNELSHRVQTSVQTQEAGISWTTFRVKSGENSSVLRSHAQISSLVCKIGWTEWSP